MADELQVGRALLKRRNPWGAWLLSLVTLSIYYCYWYYKINEEMRDYRENEIRVDPIMALLAITIGAILIVPPFVSVYRTAQRVRQAQVAAGASHRISPTVALVLAFVGFYPPYVQSQLNKAWDREFQTHGQAG